MIDLKAGPYLNKWNALDADRVYGEGVGGGGGGGREAKEEKTYSQAFIKKLHKPTHKGSVQAKRERERGAFMGSAGGHGTDEPDSAALPFNISLEGHGLVHGEGGNKDVQQKKRVKKSESNQSHGKNRTTMNSSLFGGQEGGSARPTIERGGTNTISMEVSGVGSRTSAIEGPSLLSQTTKESFIHKKQKYQSSEEDGGEQGKKLRSPVHSNSAKKPPLPVDAPEKASTNVTSAPAETSHRRSKHRKHTDGRINSKFLEISPQDPSRGKTFSSSGRSPLTMTEVVDSSSGGGSGGSPMELDNALLENQVHSNPEQAVRTALQSMASEDWSSKCEGMGMVMCVVRNYPHLLHTQLHSVLLAIIKEV